MDIELILSDETILPLKDVNPKDYYLSVKSLEPEVIALAPSRYNNIVINYLIT